MFNYSSMKPVKDEKGSLGLFDITNYHKGKIKNKVKLKIGNKYRVEPHNPKKLQHRGRTGILMGYSEDNWGRMFGKLKFDDTGRVGKVTLDELIEI